MRTKFKTATVLMALIVGSGLLIGPYLQVPGTLLPPTVEVVEPVEPAPLPGPAPVPAVAEIMAQAQNVAKVGELVRFDLSQSMAQSIKWIVMPATVDFEVYDKGRCAVFSAREPGDYMFIIAGAYRDTIDVVIHTLVVEGLPLPDIPLVKPNVQANIQAWVSYWCAVNKRPKDETERLAVSFETIAVQINAGTLQKAADIVKATAEANRTAVGDSLPEWLPVLQELQTMLKKLVGQGKLSTPDQHKTLWLDIAKGLRDYVSLIGV